MTNTISQITKVEDAAIRWLAHLDSPDLSESQKRAFFSWLNISASHQAAYIKIEKLWQRGEVLKRIENETHVDNIASYSWSAVASHSWNAVASHSWNAVASHSWIGWSFACIFVALVTFTLLPRTIEQDVYELRTVIGEQKEILLSEGSSVILNTNSQLKVELSHNKRLAYLTRGEVFFNVSSDKDRPFEVVTDAGKVRVLGTQFAVRHTKEDVIVTVIEGRVAIGGGRDDSLTSWAKNVLGANEQLGLKSAPLGDLPKKVDAKVALSWRDKQLIYRGESLETVVADLNRYFPETIHISDASVRNKQVVAVLHLSDLNSTITAFANSLNLKAEFNLDASLVSLASK